MACTFQATIEGKIAPLIGLSDEDMDINTMIPTYNTVMTDAFVVVVFALLFYVHGKHLRSCRDGQLT